MANNKEIRVEIIDTKPSGFFIQDLEKINIENIKANDLEFGLNISMSTKDEDQLIRIDIEINSYLKNNKEKEEALFGIKSLTVFRTPDFDKVIGKKYEKIDPTKDFILKLLNISIGGTRGMLATKLLETKLNHITLPLLDLLKFMKS